MGLEGCVVTSYLAPVTSIGAPPHTVPVPCDSLYTRYQISPLTWCDCPPAGQRWPASVYLQAPASEKMAGWLVSGSIDASRTNVWSRRPRASSRSRFISAVCERAERRRAVSVRSRRLFFSVGHTDQKECSTLLFFHFTTYLATPPLLRLVTKNVVIVDYIMSYNKLLDRPNIIPF